MLATARFRNVVILSLKVISRTVERVRDYVRTDAENAFEIEREGATEDSIVVFLGQFQNMCLH